MGIERFRVKDKRKGLEKIISLAKTEYLKVYFTYK